MEKGRSRVWKKTVIAAVLALGLIAIGCATASLVTDDGLFEYQVRQSIGTKAVYITKYLGTETEIVIPDQLDGFEVWGIFSRGGYLENSGGNVVGMFEGKSLTSVIFPKNLLTVEMRAFAKNNLTNVTLPNNVSLGQSVFAENPITSFTLGTDIKCYSNSLNTLTPYYYGNNKLAGKYTLDGDTWKFNGSAVNLPAIIRTTNAEGGLSLTIVALNDTKFSMLNTNPYEMGRIQNGREYWLPAGTHALSIAKAESRGAGISIDSVGPSAVIRGDFKAGTIYMFREKADKSGIEHAEMGVWTPSK